jgi:hypothetical protein
MARICALAGKTCYELKDAITYLQDAKAYLKCRARVSQTIKHLHKLEIKLACPCQSDMHPVTLTSEIRQIIEMKEMKEVLAYTDGSTKARSHEANSGCGIYLTDLEGKKVWSGGCVVRTDGNNFIAEIAAASIMIMACPPDVLLEIRIDSMAAIGALSKGILSERKRIRASGRSWLNWCRQEWQAKRHHIRLEHVASHQEEKSAASIGNDKADALANEQRIRGEEQIPQPYFTLKGASNSSPPWQ